MDLDKIIKLFIIPLLILVSIKIYFSRNRNSPIYRGPSYEITKPPGWITSKEKAYMGVFANAEEIKSVTFVDPVGKDINSVQKNSISVFSTKLKTPTWVDMLFPEIMQALQYESSKIIDRGDMNIDDQVAKWVLYEDKNQPLWILEFYFTDEKNGFYKIRCSCDKDNFGRCAKTCEDTRKSFKFVYSLFN